ncbi:unnamed protein product [Closterium sp. Naga37s-1]|nr:unnamed protein product [Closterium sp. Naga37s-1]
MATISAKRSGRRPGRLQNKLSFSSRFNDENASPYSPSFSKPSPTLLADVTNPALPLPVETVTGSEEVHPVGLAAVTQWFDGSVKSGHPPTGRFGVRSALQDFSDNSFFSFPSGKSAAMSAFGMKSVNENSRRNTSVPAAAVPPQSTQSLVEMLPPNTLKATELVPSVPIVPPRLSASVRQSISGAAPFLANYTSSSAVGLGSAPSSRRTSFAGSVDGSVSSSSAAMVFPPPSRTSQRRISALAEGAGDFSAMLPDEREFLADVAEFHGLPVRASLQSLPPLAESFPPQARQLQNGAGRRVQQLLQAKDLELKVLEEQLQRVEMERDEMGGKMKRAVEEMQRMEEQLKREEERVGSMGEEIKRGIEGSEQAAREMKRMEAEMKRMAEEMKRSEGRCGEVEASRATTQEALNSAVESNSALRDLMALQAAHIAELKALVLGQTEAIQELTRGSTATNVADAGKPVREEEDAEGSEEEKEKMADEKAEKAEEKAEKKGEEAEKAEDARSAGMEELMAMLSHQSAEISALSRAVQASTSALRRTPSPLASPSASPEPNTPLTAKLAVSAGGGVGGGAGAGAPAEPGLWRMGLPLLGSPVGFTPSPPGKGEMRVVARIKGNVYGAVPKYGGAGADGTRAGEKMGTVEEEGRGVAIGGGAGNSGYSGITVNFVNNAMTGGGSGVGGRSSSCGVEGAAVMGGARKLSLGIGSNGRGSAVLPHLALPQVQGPVDPVDPVGPVGPVDHVDCAEEAGAGKHGNDCTEGGRENAEVDEGEGEEEEYEEVQQFFSAPASPFSSMPSTPTAAAAAAAAVASAAAAASADGDAAAAVAASTVEKVVSTAKDIHAGEGEEEEAKTRKEEEEQQQREVQPKEQRESGRGRASEGSGSIFRVGGVFNHGTTTSSAAAAEKPRVPPGSASSSRLGKLVRAESQPQGRTGSRKLSMECGGGGGRERGEGVRGERLRASVEGGMVRSRSERTPFTGPHAPPNTPDASTAREQRGGRAGGGGEGVEGRALRETGRVNSRNGEGERAAAGKGVRSGAMPRWKF